jgi:hypothetical protein
MWYDGDMEKNNNMKFYIWPGIIAIIFLILSFFDWEYGFYTILRIAITIIAIYYAYYLYEYLERKDFWFWLLVVIAILFNPIIPIYLYNKALWSVIDIAAAILFLVLIIKFRGNK